jgi:mono/diheme cytochrome c family protein
MKITIPLLLLTAVVFAAGCYYDSTEALYPTNTNIPCDTTAVTYSQTIAPIITSSCVKCHGTSTANSLGGNINLEGYANLKRYASNGRLVGSVTHTPGFTAMPREANSLTACEIAQIKHWINTGMENN